MSISKIYCNNLRPAGYENHMQQVAQSNDGALFSLPEREYSSFYQADDNLAVTLKKEENNLNEYTNKYNLININSGQSEILKDAQSISKEFIKNYGLLASLSKEELLLINHSNLQPRNSTRKIYKKMSGEQTYDANIIQQINNVSRLVKKYKFANCGECTMILNKMAYDKFKDKYDINTINYYATTGDRGVAHVALLLSSKDGTQEYVLDPWLAPHNGGIFKRKSWENMIAKLYKVDKNSNINVFTNDSIVRSLKENQK